MKRLFFSIIAVLITINCTSFSGKPAVASHQNENLTWLEKWFAAWELVSKDVLSLPASTPPEMLFFDDTYIITTSEVSAPEASLIDGPKFFGQKLAWRKMPHKGQLTLPNGQKIPVGLMSFAGPTKEGNSFFVMAAPSFWESAGVASEELNLERMLTGVFLHEFAHTRQFNGFGAKVDSIDGRHFFTGVELSDDIVQDYFRYDTNYIKHFKLEVGKFYEAAFAASKQKARALVVEGLRLLAARQAKYFIDEKDVLKELDNIFLSMEGIGQYVGVAWLIHPKGGNLPLETAVKGFRRKGNQWSQEEGLALFLALTKLTTPNWSKDMFSERPTNITDLLQKAVAAGQ